ncbi:GIY-YIG nuclease family protein [Salinarchaeum sp. Harcht-Bsk1]|uniref:GIY-YIG nuclease family protein n=1 Tax=Salinarchaeum sp. Harcht-Bsk1 TaxID=1333523 RepID=UPI0009DBA596|nr:GIY-YIG nuclease family protein [Salinarchaeum sp. Harcht-Bsk1]
MNLSSIPTESGVYCMFDLDGAPAYAGQTSNIRSRLRQHFIRQDSSVSSYGRLDPWDIASVSWWTTERCDPAEQELLTTFQPYLNFSAESDTPPLSTDISLDSPDGTFALMSDQEQEFRRQPYNRVKQKMEHINRMVDKIKYADHSDDTRRTLYEHKRILEENLQEFLGVDEMPG